MAYKPKKASAKTEKKSAPKKPKKKRARTAEGEFIADDPSTPDVNEAFVSDDFARREAQRKKFAPPSVGTGTRRLGGKLV